MGRVTASCRPQWQHARAEGQPQPGRPGRGPALPASLLAAPAGKAGLKKALDKCHLPSWHETSDPTRAGARVSVERQQWEDSRMTGGRPDGRRVPRCPPRRAVPTGTPLPRPALSGSLPIGNPLHHQLPPTSCKPGFSGLDFSTAKECKQSLRPRLALRKTPSVVTARCKQKEDTNSITSPARKEEFPPQINGMRLVCIISQTRPTPKWTYF